MSHITKLKTAITKQFILKETLDKLCLPWKNIKLDQGSSPTLDLKKNPRIDFIIPQENGSNITFLWTGKNYEIGLDVSKWQQSTSISSFMSRVEQTYATILLTTSAENAGFNLSASNEITNSPVMTNKSVNNINEEKKINLVCQGWY
tara:strand:- start:18243 stop:18683 length:441 start_codon:yes stop_codon:yes gene_type:complete